MVVDKELIDIELMDCDETNQTTDIYQDNIPLLDGLAENILECCNGEELSIKRIKREDGEWVMDTTRHIAIYYPGNSYQTCVGVVSDIHDGEKVFDYYQVPYYEIVPRVEHLIKTVMEYNIERYFIHRVQNNQLRMWLDECGLMKLSNDILSVLKGGDKNRTQNYRATIDEALRRD